MNTCSPNVREQIQINVKHARNTFLKVILTSQVQYVANILPCIFCKKDKSKKFWRQFGKRPYSHFCAAPLSLVHSSKAAHIQGKTFWIFWGAWLYLEMPLLLLFNFSGSQSPICMNFEHFCKECFSLFQKGGNPLCEDIESLVVLGRPLPSFICCAGELFSSSQSPATCPLCQLWQVLLHSLGSKRWWGQNLKIKSEWIRFSAYSSSDWYQPSSQAGVN